MKEKYGKNKAVYQFQIVAKVCMYYFINTYIQKLCIISLIHKMMFVQGRLRKKKTHTV